MDRTASPQPRAPRYTVGFARDPETVRAAQRLRWRVFAEELGARLPGVAGLDRDLFDPWCEHLVVREATAGAVVGTYRLLAPEAARRLGRYYSEGEFDLAPLASLRQGLVELGRSCIHPAHRNGALIMLLWSALARYMLASGYSHLAGCASVSAADGGHAAASLYARLAPAHLAPAEYRVRPLRPVALARLDASRPVVPPPLLRGYLAAGAWICGEPALDPEFNTADFFLLLPLSRLSARYARRFLPDAERAAA
ncbi:MAG: GNAT family N-acyltransferase [Burkholderiales bacterium]|nr:GNAT family N-acyltransferase [Burkholderiales bacterium]